MTRRHIVFVAAEAQPILAGDASAGGAEVQQMLLGQEFLRAGHKVTFVVGSTGAKAFADHRTFQVVFGPFDFLQTFGGQKLKYPLLTWRLAKLYQRLRPDVIMIKEPLLVFPSVLLARKKWQTATIKQIAHDHELSDADMKIAGSRQPRVITLAYRKLLPRFDAVVCQTSSQLSAATRAGIRNPLLIPNIGHYGAEAHSNRPRDIDLLWVGTCTPRKQPEAFLDLCQQIPWARGAMAMANGTDAAYTQRVSARARCIPNLNFLGALPYAQTRDLFARSKILAFSSVSEGFSNVCLQAFQTGAVVASLSYNPDQIITEKGLGIVANSWSDWCQRTRALLNDGPLRSRFAAAALEYARATHGTAQVAEHYYQLFDRLLPVCTSFSPSPTPHTRGAEARCS